MREINYNSDKGQLQNTALITGANSGMGKAAAIALAKKGFHVIMLCRSQERGEAALKDVRHECGVWAKVDLMLCDLADMKDIRRFCAEFRASYQKLDILLNNAGVITLDRQETKDGLELQFGVNHIGHFLLTNLLLDLFVPGSRIVNVSSGAHKIGRIRFQDIAMRSGYTVFAAYGRAKLCNILFTRELALRLKARGVTVNAVHPGAVATNMGIDRETGFGRTITSLLKPFFQTPEEGAETAVYVASSPACSKQTGKYFYQKQVAKTSKKAKNRKLARRLWRYSEKVTGLS